jgi:hypothetical protein
VSGFVPDERAVDHVVGWCRYVRRTTARDYLAHEPTEGQRFWRDEALARVVDNALWRLSVRLSLNTDATFRALLLHVHGDGRRLRDFQLGEPGARMPRGARQLGYDDRAVVGLGYRRAMKAVLQEIERAEAG